MIHVDSRSDHDASSVFRTAPTPVWSDGGDDRMLRLALGRFATGVAVVTRQDQGAPVGMTINSFASVSLDPALILWSLRKESSSRDAFTADGAFAINVLSENQRDIALHFAKGHTADRAFFDLPDEGDVAPAISGCLARFDCRVHSTVDCGDHIIIIGKVLAASQSEEPPLLFYSGAFASIN